jgi:hypothetical protein
MGARGIEKEDEEEGGGGEEEEVSIRFQKLARSPLSFH